MLYRVIHLLLYCLFMGPLASFTLAEPLPGQAVPQYWGKIFSWTESGVENPTQGIMFELLHEVTKELPEYQHHYQAMSLSRGFTDLKQHNNLCMVGMVRNPERDTVGYFVGLWPVLPPQLVIRRKDRQMIAGKQSRVSLTELLERHDLHGAIIEGRFFGPTLQPLLQAASAKGDLQTMQTSSSVNNLLRMLEAGRIDFTLDYLETFLTSSTGQPELRNNLLLMPLEEAQTPGVGGIYCSRTPRGKQLIERIDQLARDPQLQARFAAIIDRYLPAEPRQPYAQWISNYFKQPTQHSLTNISD